MSEPYTDGLALDDSFLLTGLSKDEVMFLKDNEHQLRALITDLLKHDQSVGTINIFRGDVRGYSIEYVRQF